jgi:hypothetical protein
MTLSPGIPSYREKGQPEGSAVTSKTRRFRVATMSLVHNDAAGLLKRCGNGKGYLNETTYVSVRPSGLRISTKVEAFSVYTSKLL